MLEETEETIGFFCHSFVIGHIPIKCNCLPPGYAYVLDIFVSEVRKHLGTSEAGFNSSVCAGMGSKPSGTKAAVIFLPFGNKFKFGREEARR